MTLYTPLSEHDIFPTEQSLFQTRQVLTSNNQMMLVDGLDNGKYRIVQLLSTDPQDYMSPLLTPGDIIDE